MMRFNFKINNISGFITTAFIIILTVLFAQGIVYSQSVGISGDSDINKCEIKSFTISVLNNSGNPLTSAVATAKMLNLTGFTYVTGTSAIDVNGSAPFCTIDPTLSGTDLVWDIDNSCPGSPFTLNDGETLNLTFQLSTGCSAVSGSLNVGFVYEIGGTPFPEETGVLNIQVNPGAVTIKKTLNVIPQRVGQDVTWTLTVENTGFGVIENVEITDILGTGLSYVSSTQSGNNSGQTTTWTSNEYAALASMDPGVMLTMDITATVIACENLDNVADVRFGCAPSPLNTCFDTAVDGGTATASVQRIVTSPLIEYTPPDVTFDYCDDTENISFTITNTGDGTAYSVWIYADFGAISVANLSAGSIYNNIEKRFELSNPILSGGTYNLSFDLNYSSWCGGSFPSGDLLWQNVYKDECNNDFFPPVKLSTINAPANSSSLSVSKSGAGSVIQIGDTVTYNISSSYSGPLNCGSGTTGDVTVVDTVPDGFIVLNAGGGVWVPGSGGTGGTITWTYTPPASLNTSVILQAPLVGDCETYCNTLYTNSITATSTDCCGCVLNASDSETTAIECEEGVDSEKTYTSPVERCDEIEYTNTYTFSMGSSVILENLNFEEHAENLQEYVAGSLSVTLTGSGDITGSVSVTDNTPGGRLILDFSGAGAISLDGSVLVITYSLTATESTTAPCADSTFYSWSSLEMGTTGSECLGDGIIHETVPVTILAPSMSLSVTGLGNIINKCETQTITIDLSQTSVNSDPKDVRLVLSGLNYYVVDPSAAVCTGAVSPSTCTPSISGDDYVWEFNDAFTGSGQNAQIQLLVQKRCSGTGDLTATVYFDDQCTDDSTFDDTCSVASTETPALLLSGDLLIEKTPEVYYASTNQIQWVIYVTNRGSGKAYNVWVDDELGSGLDYVSSVVDNMTGVLITADQDHDGNAINGALINIAEMAAGERRAITFNALLIDCTDLTNDVSTSWGCDTVECQTVVTDNSIVEIPAPNLINTNTITPAGGVDACSSPKGFITLRNSGQVTCYNLQITETLPINLLYVADTTRWRLNGGTWNGPGAAFNPVPTTSPIVWTNNEIPGLASLNPGDTIEIEFDMISDCPFTGGDIMVSTQYENPCADVFTTSDSTFTAVYNAPQVEITKTRVDDDPINCAEAIQWIITVRNTSGYTLPIIWLEDTLDAAFTYVSSTNDPPFNVDGGVYDGTNKVVWELRNVDHNDTVTLLLNATTDSSPCSPNLDNTVLAWWGCGAADGSSLTKPGVTSPDNNLCLTSTAESDVRTETRQPDLAYLSVAMSPLTIDSCDDSTELTIVVENTGPTDARNVDLVITLPSGLTYNNGTAESGLGTSSGAGTSGIPDPAGSSTSTLTFYNIADTAAGKADNIADTIESATNNDTLVLKFSVQSSCYMTDDVDITMHYYDCCDDRQYSSNTSMEITANFPELSVTKTPVYSQVECGTNQTWLITVTNNGTGNAEVVRVVDTLGNWIDYVSSGGPHGAAIAMGGQVYGWEINNLASGSSTTFTITGTLNPDGLPNQADCDLDLRENEVQVYWGCGTSGDATDVDPNTTTYDCVDTSPVSATPAVLQMPDIRVIDIDTNIACSSDGVFSGTIRVRLRNAGNGATLQNFDIVVTDGFGWTGTYTYTGTLSAGRREWVTIDTSTWAPDCNSCTPYTITATADPASSNTVCECNETNNSRTENYTAPIPDLTITDIDFTNVSCSNDSMSGYVTVAVRNTGCAAASNVPVSLLTDGCLTFSDQTITTLAAGASTNVTFNISGSWSDCTSETCQFTAEVDPTGIICECDGTNNTRVETYSTTLPDLVVTDIDFTNMSCVNDSISGTVEVTIQNSGFGSANNFEVSLASDGCLNFSNETVSTALTNGSSTTITFSVTGSWADCTDCSCDITATVDATNAICECDGTNNQRTETYTNPLSDLRVNTVTPSATCTSDGNLSGTVVVNVENIGCADASNVVVRLVSTCGIVFVDQTLNLTQGTDTDLTFNYTPDCSSCTCTFVATIDPDNTICECTGTNNSVTSTPFTHNIPDIQVQGETLAVSCSADGQAIITGNITLTNTGCGSNLTTNVPVRITMYDNTGCTGNVISQWTETLSGINISSGGGSQSLAISPRTIVSDLIVNSTGCRVSFRIEADYNTSICECDGTNNSYCADNKAVDIPDLEVSSDTLAVSCLSDGQVIVAGSVTMANNGCGSNMNTNIPVRFTLYDNTGCTGNQIYQWTETLSSSNIPAGGGTQTFSISPENITADMVSSSTGCQASIRIELDHTGTICESDGTDNTYCADNKNVDIPDIEVSSDAITVSCTSDGQASISGSVTLSNNGCGSNLIEDVPMRFTLYDDSGCSGNTITQWTETFTSVNIPAGGGTQTFAVTLQNLVLDMVASSNNCRVSIRIEPDYTATICESDGVDNDQCSEKIVQIPDLDINSTTPTVSCFSDGMLQISFDVTNGGCTDINTDFNIRITDNTGSTRTGSFVSLGGTLPLARNTTEVITITDWDFDCSSSSIDFQIEADTGDVVCESSSANNTISWTYTLTEPDLVFGSISYNCNSDATIEFTIPVENTGYGDATGVIINVYDDSSLIHSETFDVAAGSTETIIFTSGAYQGDVNHNFRFVLDESTAVCECNGNNNEDALTINCPTTGLVTEKLVSQSAVSGCSEVDFTLSVSNVGFLNAYNLIVRDILPRGFKYVTGTTISSWPGGSYSADPVINGNTLEWSIGATLNGGIPEGETLTLTFRAVSAVCTEGESFLNTMNAYGLDGSGVPIPANGSDPEDTDPDDSDTANIRLICPKLEVNVVCPDTKLVAPGEIFETSVFIRNSGSVGSDFKKISISDLLPEGWIIDSYSVSGANVTSGPVSGDEGRIEWIFDNLSLRTQDELVINIRLRADSRSCGLELGDNILISSIGKCGEVYTSTAACSIKTICGVPLLKVDKSCPRAEQPGGIYRFEISIENSGDVSADDVKIRDIFPERFEYIEGTSALDGLQIADPSGISPLTWHIGSLDPGEKKTLIYTLIAPADLDPGEYCNEAFAEGIGQDKSDVTSNVSRCCTILRRDLSGCCIDIEQWVKGFYKIPDLPISFIDPYFKTEEAMFAVYSSIDFIKAVDFDDDSMAQFVRNRIKNYALSTVEEFYLRSGMGKKLSDGSIYLSYGGSYPERDKKVWKSKRVNKTMTSSQIAFELLALNNAISINEDEVKSEQLKRVMNEKLKFITKSLRKNSIHEWEVGKKRVEAGEDELTKRDLSALYFAASELKGSGVTGAAEFLDMITTKMDNINGEFEKDNYTGELLTALGLFRNGSKNYAEEKIDNLKKVIDENEVSPDSIFEYSLAIYCEFKIRGTFNKALFEEMKKRYYVPETGIFSERQSDFTHRLSIKDLGALMLSFEPSLPESREFFTQTFYRMMDETGIFLNKKNIIVENSPLNLIRNYPFGEELLPMLSFIKGEENIAPVFTNNAVVYSPSVKPLGQDLFPFRFSKLLSPEYETDTSRISLLSFYMQHLGTDLEKDKDRLIRERGRSLKKTGRGYIDSIFESNSGIKKDGLLLVPYNKLALKGQLERSNDMEPLRRGISLTTETLVNYMIGAKYYISGGGAKSEALKSQLEEQLKIIRKLESMSTIPAGFTLLTGESGFEVVGGSGEAGGMTIAKIFYLTGNEQTERYLALLKEGKVHPEDVIFFHIFPEVSKYFSEGLTDLLNEKGSGLEKNSGKLLAAKILNDTERSDPESLKKLWDNDIALPLTEVTDSIGTGSVHHYDSMQLMLYLYSKLGWERDFRFDRTLGFLTYLAESEWGVKWNNKSVPLPAEGYWLIKQDPRERPEPGDRVSFRVRIENKCPISLARGRNIPSLLIKSVPGTNLVYSGSESVPGLTVLNDYLWKYDDFAEGDILEFTYQSQIPERFESGDYYQSTIFAKGFSEYMEGFGENDELRICEDSDEADGWRVIPLELKKGLVYEDRNVNGRRDSGERGLPGILFRDTRGKVYRSDTEGNIFIPVGDDITGVQIDLNTVPSRYILSTALTHRVDRNSNAIPLYGLIPCTVVSGYVYIDSNSSGYFDEGDITVSNVIVSAGEKTTLTTEGGRFNFNYIPEIWKEDLKIKSYQPYLKSDFDKMKILINIKKRGN